MRGRHHTRHSCWQLLASGRPMLLLQCLAGWMKKEETPLKCQIHTHTFFRRQEGQELTRSLMSPLLSLRVMPCCCGFTQCLKTRGWGWLGNSQCTAMVLHKSRDEHLLTLVCVPTSCYRTYAKAKVGTRNGVFPKRWRAELGSTKKPEHGLKSHSPEGFPSVIWAEAWP